VRDTKVFENPGRPDHLVTGDYELVPLTKAAAERRPELKVLAYEILARDVQPRGLNVLFADGSVQYIEYGAFQQLYRQTLESLGR
jgi:prepilin-type processing-associated H-X9-DG protein